MLSNFNMVYLFCLHFTITRPILSLQSGACVYLRQVEKFWSVQNLALVISAPLVSVFLPLAQIEHARLYVTYHYREFVWSGLMDHSFVWANRQRSNATEILLAYFNGRSRCTEMWEWMHLRTLSRILSITLSKAAHITKLNPRASATWNPGTTPESPQNFIIESSTKAPLFFWWHCLSEQTFSVSKTVDILGVWLLSLTSTPGRGLAGKNMHIPFVYVYTVLLLFQQLNIITKYNSTFSWHWFWGACRLFVRINKVKHIS